MSIWLNRNYRDHLPSSSNQFHSYLETLFFCNYELSTQFYYSCICLRGIRFPYWLHILQRLTCWKSLLGNGCYDVFTGGRLSGWVVAMAVVKTCPSCRWWDCSEAFLVWLLPPSRRLRGRVPAWWRSPRGPSPRATWRRVGAASSSGTVGADGAAVAAGASQDQGAPRPSGRLRSVVPRGRLRSVVPRRRRLDLQGGTCLGAAGGEPRGLRATQAVAAAPLAESAPHQGPPQPTPAAALSASVAVVAAAAQATMQSLPHPGYLNTLDYVWVI